MDKTKRGNFNDSEKGCLKTFSGQKSRPVTTLTETDGNS